MSRKVEQKTFDDVVKENVETFGHSPDEAVADAVAQFEAQGVDLSGIARDAGGLAPGGRPAHPSVTVYAELERTLEGFSTAPSPADVAAVAAALGEIAEGGGAYRSHEGAARITQRAVTAAVACEPAQPHLVRVAANALRAVCTSHEGNRAAVSTATVEALLSLVAAGQPLEVVRAAMLALAVLCVKREAVKKLCFERGADRFLAAALASPELLADAALVRDGCVLLQRMLTDDDLSVNASDAYAHARELAADGFAPLLLAALEVHQRRYGAAAEVCAALRAIAVNDPICRDIEAAGGVARVTAVLAAHIEDLAAEQQQQQQQRGGRGAVSGAPSAGGGAAAEAAPPPAEPAAAAPAAAAPVAEEDLARRQRMVRAGFGVLRSLSNSDAVKVAMCAGDARPLRAMLAALQVLRGAPGVLEHVIGCLASVSLRQPGNAAAAVAAGALPLVARAMEAHPGAAGVQRAGCLAVRSLVVRAPDRIALAIDEGFEGILQRAYAGHAVARDVSYAALRDMGFAYAETTIGLAAVERAARAVATGDIAVK